MERLTRDTGFYVIEKSGNELHILADIYYHDVNGWWTSEEPCGFYTTLEDFAAVGGSVTELEGWDGRKNYIYDDIKYDRANEEWSSLFHVHTVKELQFLTDGQFIWEY